MLFVFKNVLSLECLEFFKADVWRKQCLFHSAANSASPFLRSMFKCFRDIKESGHLFLHLKKVFFNWIFSQFNVFKIEFFKNQIFFQRENVLPQPAGRDRAKRRSAFFERNFLRDNSTETLLLTIESALSGSTVWMHRWILCQWIVKTGQCDFCKKFLFLCCKNC